MSFKSKAQQRWGNSPAGIEALGGKEKVAEWNKATTEPLPERIGKTRVQRAKEMLKRGMAGRKR